LRLQLAVLLGSTTVGVALQAAALALIAGAVPYWCSTGRLRLPTAARLGLSLGAIGAGAAAVSALSSNGPLWPSYAGAATFAPLIASATTPVLGLLTRITLLLLIVGAANRLTAGWTRRRTLTAVLIVAVGGVLGNSASPLNIGMWITAAIVIGLILIAVYVFVLRHDVSVIPLAAAVVATVGTLPEGLSRAYPGALPGALIAVAIMWLAAYAWFRTLSGPHRTNMLGDVVTA
jgi:hypothetical protein